MNWHGGVVAPSRPAGTAQESSTALPQKEECDAGSSRTLSDKLSALKLYPDAAPTLAHVNKCRAVHAAVAWFTRAHVAP